MTPKNPLPCHICGRPVRHLGAVKWTGNGDRKDGFLTGLHPICAECLADPKVQSQLESKGEEAIH